MSVMIYGIKTCDTMKKAFAWLDAKSIAYVFHDYREEGIDRSSLENWCKAAGWEKVLNKASTTFRNLPDDAKSNLNEETAIDLMFAQPTLIKRPVLQTGGRIEIGFKPDHYSTIFSMPQKPF